jgi:hypothetical protein
VPDKAYTAEERRWLRGWNERRQQVADGTMTAEALFEWAWKDKVLNAINVTIQRIKRSERPGMDPRRNDSTWVTVVAEPGRKKEDLSVLGVQAFAYVFQRLKERDHEFDVDWMATANGVVVLSVNVKALRAFMERRAAEEPRPAADEHHQGAS